MKLSKVYIFKWRSPTHFHNLWLLLAIVFRFSYVIFLLAGSWHLVRIVGSRLARKRRLKSEQAHLQISSHVRMSSAQRRGFAWTKLFFRWQYGMFSWDVSNTIFGNLIHRKSEHAGLKIREKSGNSDNIVQRSKFQPNVMETRNVLFQKSEDVCTV